MTPYYLASVCQPATRYALVGGALPAGIACSAAGVLSGTPTSAQVSVARIRAYRGTRNPDASWNARKAGAFNSERFDSDVVTNRGNPRNLYDTSVSRSGVASLKQFKLSNESHVTGPVAKWDYSTRVAQSAVTNPNSGLVEIFNSNTGFGPGEELYLQFSVRPDAGYVDALWPPAPKLVIIDNLPWATNLNLGPTANDWEVVISPRESCIHGYENSPQGPPWEQSAGALPGGDLNLQPSVNMPTRVLNGDNPGLASGAGPAWTAAQQKRAQYGELYSSLQAGLPDGHPDPLQAFGQFARDQWHTILVHLKNGSGTVSQSSDVGSMLAWDTPGLVEVFMAHEGQDYVQVHGRTYRPHVTRTSAPHYDRSGTLTNAQDTTWSAARFTPLVFNNDLVGIGATAMWIDEIVSSQNFIPSPDIGDGTSNYRTKDVLVTFKVS